MIRSAARQRAFTMIEVFGVLVLITVLVTMLLPAVQSAREAARRSSCANNMMQIGLAAHAYHTSFGQLPVQLAGTDGSVVVGEDNDRRLSYLVGLLPFLDEGSLADQINGPLSRGWKNESALGMGPDMWMEEAYPDDSLGGEGLTGEYAENETFWPAGGPEPFTRDYLPWNTEPPAFRCPSDPGIGNPALARTNYAACLGDGVVASDSGPMKEVNGVFVIDDELAKQTEAAMRGMFVPRVVTRLSDTTDGLSSTILLGELATALGDRDTRTCPIWGPGATVLRDDPAWARERELIDIDRPQFWANPDRGDVLSAETGMRRGYRWADGMPLYTGCNTILPPNREITLSDDRDDCWGVLPPSSRHQGGAQICFGDGAVRFITDSVDAGRPDQPTVYEGSPNSPPCESPFGVWGAMGTRASGELEMLGSAQGIE